MDWITTNANVIMASIRSRLADIESDYAKTKAELAASSRARFGYKQAKEDADAKTAEF